MFSDYRVLAVIYSVVLGFAISFAAMYLLHLIRTYVRGTVYYDDYRDRLRDACHSVTAQRIHHEGHGVIKPGYHVTHWISTYVYQVKGKRYTYTWRGDEQLPPEVTLYFLSDPRCACVEEELGAKDIPWGRYILPLGCLISLVMFRYILHWMEIVQAR